MSRFSPLLVFIIGTCIAAPLFAQERAENSIFVDSQARDSSQQALEKSHATEWGLNPEEWKRYQSLMQGSRGIYSPGADPLTVLGVEARSDEERRHYAELQAKAEANRVQKELLYQRAYDEAAARLNNGQLPVNMIKETPAQSPLEEGSGRIAVFVKPDCPPCSQRVKQLQASGVQFDIYMIGSRGKDEVIRKWAISSGIDPAKVRNRDITLNHDEGRWLSLGGQGDLPAVLRKVGNQWQRQ